MSDERHWSEDRKIASLEPRFANAVLSVLDRLRAADFVPKVVFAWRSAETQKKLFAAGNSRTLDSMHTRGEEGEGRAVDIVDAEHWWGAGEAQSEAQAMLFFGALGLAAREEGLNWGGDWESFRDYAHVQAG